MTLQEFFDYLSDNPLLVIAYFILIPFFAFVVNKVSGRKALSTPFAELYSTLIYLVAIPALLATALNMYFFLFERRSILLMNLYTQLLPIISFIGTLLIIRKHVSLDNIPGFGKLSGLIITIFAGFAIMWLLDRTRIFFVAFSYMPFHYVLLIFIGILIAIRFGWKRLFK
ncbi:MAG: hypothetical protein WBA74_08035 [Cyclobacteriaceae bacterium]